jgi:hypothetical protein
MIFFKIPFVHVMNQRVSIYIKWLNFVDQDEMSLRKYFLGSLLVGTMSKKKVNAQRK